MEKSFMVEERFLLSTHNHPKYQYHQLCCRSQGCEIFCEIKYYYFKMLAYTTGLSSATM